MTGVVVLAPTAAESFAAIGTTATVVVSERSALGTAVSMLRADVDDLDRACSRFRADSEIRAVERADAPTGIGPTLATHVGAALWAAEVTDGLLDPTVGSCLDALGYDRDFGRVTDTDDAVHPVPAPGRRSLEWHPRSATLRVPPGVRVDLGSTAKALAADLAAARIAGRIGGGVLVDLGGDIAVAGPAPDDDGWRIRIAGTSRRPGPVVAIRSGGLATSGTTRRRWRRGAATLHHVVHPATGRPAGGPWTTVTVAAGSCLDANVAATAALLLGDDAPDWLAGRLPARLVDDGGRPRTVGDWPAEAVAR